ncbi:MAG: hypothetical protein AAB923_01865 [Patescibacteria group bacterium]
MSEGPPGAGAREAASTVRAGRVGGVPSYIKTAFRWAIGFAALALGVAAVT